MSREEAEDQVWAVAPLLGFDAAHISLLIHMVDDPTWRDAVLETIAKKMEEATS